MNKKKLITNGLIIFSLIIVPIALNYFRTESNAAYKTGEYWGECLWIWLIPNIATRKKTDKTKANVKLFAAIVLLIFSIITSYNTYNEHEAMEIALSNVQLLKENKDLLDTKSAGNNLTNLLDGIVKVAEPYNKKMITLQDEMYKIDISFAVKTDIFTNKTKLLEAKSTLNIFIQNTKNQRELTREMFEATLSYIQNYDLDKYQKDEFMRGYNQSQNTAMTLLKQKYSLWDKMSSNIQIILDLATNNLGKVEVKNNKLLFSSNEIADKYNLALAALQKNAEDEDILIKEMVKSRPNDGL
ncbi:MAG: hypothetical protein NTY69_05875 [Methylococcales bacterium]|nr:hypothetical protein [Methylococcales bacterium]